MEKLYMNGRAFIPKKDILICNVCETDPMKLAFAGTEIYERIYATTKGTFYKVRNTERRKEARILSKEEAFSFLEENAAYIITDNYDSVFGEPERG